ncbi:glycosyltransferase family 2 protein [Providencia rustigianii]|uniref:Glycosyltransferase, group 2 family protein n=5 Tax=Providencia rustigianii TaxID=158850 RepID=D1P7H4_9GAMM|nr:glycosyltransferase [Providencia rustigianii]EFB70714.1 glycosyltransferase, group 2 family protein [Providencia rustigianii DSM 4541]SUC29074.1 Poly-beta-1,6-N-acetyl-D-glucosamine synthase [Providencia rustigianii]
MKNIKLSIIIPCFNSEKYIDECLSSVLVFMNPNIEVIIINDGSTDDSEKIILAKKETYSDLNIHYLKRENGGLSKARNHGISVSSGEYIAFLDADDFLDSQFFYEIESILSSNYDIIEFDTLKFEDSNREITQVIKTSNYSAAISINEPNDLLPVFNNKKWFAWSRVYKSNLFKHTGIHYPDGILYEDMATTPKLYLKAQSVYSINKPLIHYRVNETSITQTFRRNDINSLIYVMATLSFIALIYGPYVTKMLIKSQSEAFHLLKKSVSKNTKEPLSDIEIKQIHQSMTLFKRYLSLKERLQLIFLKPYLWFKNKTR